MAKRRSSSVVPAAKHRLGYDASWSETFPWLIAVREDTEFQSDEARTSPTAVTGLLCSLCRRHSRRQRNGTGTWAERPCTYLRKDMLERHEKSVMHRDAKERETTRMASQRDGGIKQAFSQ